MIQATDKYHSEKLRVPRSSRGDYNNTELSQSATLTKPHELMLLWSLGNSHNEGSEEVEQGQSGEGY